MSGPAPEMEKLLVLQEREQKKMRLEKKREKALLKEFDHYRAFTGRRLKEFRLEALRAGFRAAWGNKDYQTIIDIAKKDLKSARDVFKLESLRNRGHKALADTWWEARIRALESKNPPKASPKGTVLPPPKAWAEKNPEAAVRWEAVRPAINDLAAGFEIAPELIVSPDIVRRLCWEGGSRLHDGEELREWLGQQQSRPWQIDLLIEPVIAAASTLNEE